MPWKRGEKSTDVELSRVQECVEWHDLLLNGPNGDNGMIQEWRDFKAQRKAFESFMKAAVVIIGIVLSILTFLEGNRQLHDHTLNVPGVIHSLNPDPVYAEEKQYAY
jgi:hypothetical protein